MSAEQNRQLGVSQGQTDKNSDDMTRKTQDSNLCLTQMKPPAICGQNDHGQSTDNESGTTESDMTSGGQSIMSERTSKDSEEQTNAEEFQKTESEKSQKDDDVQRLKDSIVTDNKKSNEMFSSAKKHIEDVLQLTEEFKESQKKQIENAKKEIRDRLADSQAESHLLFIQDEVQKLTDSFLESQNKHLCAVHENLKEIEKKQQDKKPDDLDIKTQQDLQLSSQSAPPSGLTQMEPHATCGHESGTTVSEETSGGQGIMSGHISKDAEEQTNAEEFQKTESEKSQKDDVQRLKDSPETNVKEYNEMFSSAIKHIEYFLQHNELLKESLKNKIETVKREIHDHPAYSQTEDHLLCIQSIFDYSINFLHASLTKQLGDVKDLQIKFEKILQDKNPDDLDIKTQQDLQLSSQSAPTSGLTQMEPHATCGHESGTTVSEETSGGQSIMTGRTPKEAEDSPETDIKEYDEMFSSAKKHIEHVYQHTHGFKESLKNEIESAKEEIRDWSGDPLTKRLLYFMQVAFDYFIDFLLESLSKNLGDVKKIQIKFEKILQVSCVPEVMKKEKKSPASGNWTWSGWPTYKVLVIEVAGSVKTSNTQEMFLNEFSKKLKNHNIRIQKAQLNNESRNLVLLFCPEVSRIGTDIAVALKKVSSHKKIILVVMHHTPNPEYIVADSSRLVDQENVVLTVDCLFHETTGLLNCNLNNESSKKVCDFIPSFI